MGVADHAKKAENSSISAEKTTAEVLVEDLVKNNNSADILNSVSILIK